LPTKTTPSAGREARPKAGGDFILALPLTEHDQGKGSIANELFNGRDKTASDGLHHARGSHGMTAVSTNEPQGALDDLKSGNVDVQIQAVDRFQLQGDVLFQKGGHVLCYGHRRLRLLAGP
jgi:hypothetical protein